MKTAKPRKAIAKSTLAVQTFHGQVNAGRKYLLVLSHLRGTGFTLAFGEHELKAACFDILGIADT